MLTKLKLTNFRQHTDLTINFTSGLQAIRGKNEAGKSTILHGIAYAWWGSRALPMPLEDMVTWGFAPGTLKVELSFTHDGAEYSIKRSKSGAELTGPGVTASGQAEVTSFMERLFGAPAAICQATMLTRQKALQDGLDSSALTLIERLANMQLIDELVNKIQTNLPSGNTKTLESQLSVLSNNPLPVYDVSALEVQLIAQRQQCTTGFAAVVEAQETVNKLLKPVADAREKEVKNRQTEVLRASLEKQRIAALAAQVVMDVVIPDITKLEQELADQQEALGVLEAWNRFTKLPKVGKQVPVSEDLLRASVAVLRTELQHLTTANAQRDREYARKEALLITETACGLCGKDLQNVPEVVQKNAETQTVLDQMLAEHLRTNQLLAATTEKLAEQEALLKLSEQITSQLSYLNHCSTDLSVSPPAVTWVGPTAAETVNVQAAAKALRDARLLEKNHKDQLAASAAAKHTLEQVNEALAKLEVLELSEAEVYALAALPAAESQVKKLETDLELFKRQVTATLSAMDTAKAVHDSRMQAWETSQKQKMAVEASIKDYQFHNGIIDKLRTARPIVARKLWGLVLAGVSHYFSAIRGTASVVTRGENGFLIDGKGVGAFSGSTTDCLSMANRIMLQKTFLPGVNVMLIDEPGAAFDDIREADLLGVLASCGLEQVILVTHSELADSFASQVIQL